MRNNDGVREERTGWRDEWISERHRLWGADVPMADIDFLAVEYDLKMPVAIVDYKGFAPRPIDVDASASLVALRWLADMGGLMLMIVFYNRHTSVFTVRPLNRRAKEAYTLDQVMSEREYVTSLYTLRRRSVPQQILSRLNAFKPTGRRHG
jgi:hypothetical protein